jgi:hypothetical protein
MKRGLTISCIGHGLALLWAVVAISASPMQAPPTQALPVEFISANDFTKLTQGVKNAKLKLDHVKPLADKVDKPKPVDQLAAKAADKPEIKTQTAPAPEPKPQPKTAAKPEKTKAPQLKLDQIADLLKKEDAKKQPKPPKKVAHEKPARKPPKFDANQVAALLDHRDPRRQFASAATLNDTASIGAVHGEAARLSQSEIDAFRARLSQCWNPPAGVTEATKIYVVLRVLFRPDGSMAREPVVVEGPASALGPALADSAKRALLLCQPFTMLRPEHYEQWKDIEVKFDPQELLGG